MDLYRELIAHGATPADVVRQIRSGEVIRLRRGAFTRPQHASTPEQRHGELIAATMPVLSPKSVLSHVSAGVLHDLPVPLTTLNRVHVTRDGRGGRISKHTHLHAAAVASDEIIELRGWSVTSLTRTVIDLARWLPYADAVPVVDSALRSGLDRAELLDELAKSQRRPGNERARQAVEFGDGRAESPGESRSRVVMAQLGLPMPTLQREFLGETGTVDARVDFDWEEFGVSGEFDGLIKYGRLLQPGQSVDRVIMFEKQREERLREHGRWVIRWVHDALKDPKRFGRMIEQGFRNGPTGCWPRS